MARSFAFHFACDTRCDSRKTRHSAGVMSAFGMLSGAQSFETVRAFRRGLDAVGEGELEALLDEAVPAVVRQMDKQDISDVRRWHVPIAG